MKNFRSEWASGTIQKASLKSITKNSRPFCLGSDPELTTISTKPLAVDTAGSKFDLCVRLEAEEMFAGFESTIMHHFILLLPVFLLTLIFLTEPTLVNTGSVPRKRLTSLNVLNF